MKLILIFRVSEEEDAMYTIDVSVGESTCKAVLSHRIRRGARGIIKCYLRNRVNSVSNNSSGKKGEGGRASA